MISYSGLIDRQKELKSIIRSLETTLEDAPEGHLIARPCGRAAAADGHRFNYYLYDNKKEQYLKRKDLPLAEKLAEKKYRSYCLDAAKQELSIINYSLRHYADFNSRFDKFSEKHPGHAVLLKDSLKPSAVRAQDHLSEWITDPDFRIEGRKITTLHGEKVRSKSEALVANILYKNNIPYVYEPKLKLTTGIIHPDFLIIHPITVQLFLWEHFGLMDNSDYGLSSIQKLNLYSENDFFPGNNLITTFETRERPLEELEVQYIIHRYFL